MRSEKPLDLATKVICLFGQKYVGKEEGVTRLRWTEGHVRTEEGAGGSSQVGRTQGHVKNNKGPRKRVNSWSVKLWVNCGKEETDMRELWVLGIFWLTSITIHQFPELKACVDLLGSSISPTCTSSS